jgi:hypothetical protein
VKQSAQPPPTDPPGPEWRALARADWEARLAEARKLEEQGLWPAGSTDFARVQMEIELRDEDGSAAHYWQNVDRDKLAQEREQFGALGPPLSPVGQVAMHRRYLDFYDAHIQDERTTPESRFRFLQARGAVARSLSQRAGDLVGALLARARQTRRSPRAREQRSRRSGPPSRDGPGDGEDDEPDDVDGARRRSS